MEALDGFMHGLLAAAHRQQRHVGVLFVESFRSCFKHQDDCDKSCGKFEEGRQGLFNTSIAGAARKAPHMQGAIIINRCWQVIHPCVVTMKPSGWSCSVAWAQAERHESPQQTCGSTFT